MDYGGSMAEKTKEKEIQYIMTKEIRRNKIVIQQ